MYKPAIQVMPPLRIWVFIFIVTLGIGTLLFFHERSNFLSLYASRKTYIEKGFQQAIGKPVVLIIGTSLLESDIFPCDSIEANLNQFCHRNMKVLKLWKRGDDLSGIINQMPILLEVHPNLVVIEANLFFYRPLNVPVLSRYVQTYRDMILFKDLNIRYAPDSMPVFGTMKNVSLEKFRDGMTDTSDLRSFRELAVLWQSKGTKFLFINFPVEESEEFKKWNCADTLGYMRNLQFLKEKIFFSNADDHLRLNQSNFYDNAHMNPKGNSIFSSFFCRSVCLQLEKL
jgi:hypothetical protein